MTKEEALKILDTIPTISEQVDALEMAIEALEQEPCEDAISRQAVIDSLHSKFADGFDSDRWWNSMSVLYAINKVPSVSTKKTGRWEKLSVGYGCSECSLCTNIHGIRDFKYCPNCGAKMEVEE